MKRIEVLSADIVGNRRLSARKIYAVEGEVRVRTGARLSIDDGVTILLVNGVFPKSLVRRSALIFDPGSALSARRFTVKAADARHRAVRCADNGGLWFLGNHANAAKDGVSVRTSLARPPSRFKADRIITAWLGRKDTYISARTGRELDIGDDIDGFSVLGVGPEEWRIAEVRSRHSGDDGIDFTNSHVRIDRLEVSDPTEDGINVSSSRVEIRKRLVLRVTPDGTTDRDLFDLETDDGASYVELHARCWVQVEGVFGDQLRLDSDEMPRPDLRDDNETGYAFRGRLRQAALVFSIDQD